jgi:serine/threonine protein kinase
LFIFSQIESHVPINNSGYITQCYGITRDSETNDFIMVMEYAKYGSLRQYLNNHFNSLNWKNKLWSLYGIANGLSYIHKNKLIHHDFHCGNILCYGSSDYLLYSLITDLGLCKPANVKSPQSGDKQVYGVLPYVAPEVLRGKEYTQASDIYGFGIIAYELCTGLPPYRDIAHEESLAVRICQGLRPKSNYKIPQLILNIIKQCWDADSSKRPKAEKLKESFWDLRGDAYNESSVINEQIEEANEINEKLSSSKAPSLPSTGILSYTTHSQAIYTSRLLDFKNLPEPKNADDNDETEYSGNKNTLYSCVKKKLKIILIVFLIDNLIFFLFYRIHKN